MPVPKREDPTPPNANGKDRVAFSGAANIVGFGVTTLVAILFIPFLLRHMGTTAFGVWALIGAAIVVLQLTDVGLPRALSRATAEAWGQGDMQQMRRLLSSTLTLFLVVGSLAALAIALLSDQIARSLLSVPSEWQADAGFALIVIGVAVIPTLVASGLAATLEGMQRMDLSNLALVIGRVSFAGLAAFMIIRGAGVRGLAVSTLVGMCVQAAVALFALRHAWPGEHRAKPDRAVLRSLIAFGIPVVATNAVGLAYVPWSKLVLAHSAQVMLVGYYEVIATFATQVFLLAWTLAMAAYPALAYAWRSEKSASVAHLYGRALRWGAVVVLPVGIGLFVLADPLLLAWLGEKVQFVTRALQIVTVGWLISALTAPAAVTLQAVGRPDLVLLGVVVNGSVSATLSVLWVPQFGLEGVALANMISAVLSSLLLLWLCQRTLNLRGETTRQVVRFARPLLASFFVPLAWLISGTFLLQQFSGGILWATGIVAAGYVGLYVICTLAWGPLEIEEQEWLRQHMPMNLWRQKATR